VKVLLDKLESGIDPFVTHPVNKETQKIIGRNFLKKLIIHLVEIVIRKLYIRMKL
jgi:hypothetical protein